MWAYLPLLVATGYADARTRASLIVAAEGMLRESGFQAERL